MKRIVLLCVGIILSAIFAVNIAIAEGVYLPGSNSDQFLPTVKIFTYDLTFDGSLVGQGYGSGTLIDNKGTVLTNNHVIENFYDRANVHDAFQICLTRANKPDEPVCQYTASFLARDKDRDLGLLRMNSTDVLGRTVDFSFYLPYVNTGNYSVGEDVTVIGFPDIGGSTVTFTKGLISGFVTDLGLDYIKTDADISFGNSGGTALDSSGNFIGVPTYTIGSYSSEALGYLFPVKNAVDWINKNINTAKTKNDVADNLLRKEISKILDANIKGVYRNEYPVYEVALINGWKFASSGVEATLSDQPLLGSYSGEQGVTMYPLDQVGVGYLSLSVSAEEFPYDLTTDDIEDVFTEYLDGSEGFIDKVKLNDKYDAVRLTSTYEDELMGDEVVQGVMYGIPYGNQLVRVAYSYKDGDIDALNEIKNIVKTFKLDLSKVKSTVVSSVSSDVYALTVVNPLLSNGVFLSDQSYEFDGQYFFSATFGKKDVLGDFYTNVFAGKYWDKKFVDNFSEFKASTLRDADSFYNIVAKGDLKVDGHDGFFYTERYDEGNGEATYYVDIYLNNMRDSYVSVHFSASSELVGSAIQDFSKILSAIKFHDNSGKGAYVFANFLGAGEVFLGSLVDVENYIYEDSVNALFELGVFGINGGEFFPAVNLSRRDFLVWVLKSLPGDRQERFKDFEESYQGCGDLCFADVANEDQVYLSYAFRYGAVGGMAKDGVYYFDPNSQISLIAAWKIIFNIYEYPVWKAPDFVPWYMPYVHLGYVNGAVPYGVNSNDYLLTRGEGAFVIDMLRGLN